MKISNVKTKEQLLEESLLPAGEYSFQISAAEPAVSKSGNDMIVLTVRVFKPDGNFILITDYLLEAMQFKLVHACEACGLYDKYLTGEIHPGDFIGKTGVLKLGVQKSDDYPDRNTIKDYVAEKKADILKDALSNLIDGDDDSDEIPF